MKGRFQKSTSSGSIVRPEIWMVFKNFSSNREDSWRDETPMANGFLAYLFSRDFFAILENKEI